MINKKYSDKYCYVDNYGCFVKARLFYFLMFPIWKLMTFIVRLFKKVPKGYKLSHFYLRMLAVYLLK